MAFGAKHNKYKTNESSIVKFFLLRPSLWLTNWC